MQTIVIGLIPAPDLCARISKKMEKGLCDQFSKWIDSSVDWKLEVVVDPLTGAAESAEEIIEEAKYLKAKHNWDYALGFTDLPILADGRVVLADANPDEHVAQISLPAFGLIPLPKRIQRSIVQMIGELYYTASAREDVSMKQRGIGPTVRKDKKSWAGLFRKAFRLSPIRRINAKKSTKNIQFRFVIFPKFHARIRLILGMTFANSPWSILPSFKRVVAIAFATGAYGLIFPTLWQVSVFYDYFRFSGLMAAAMFGMVIWIIFAHNLWEPKTKMNKLSVQRLYNETTILTLFIAVAIYYLTLFGLFFIAVVCFVPPDLFIAQTAIEAVHILDYLKLAWLVTSVATVAGALGAGLENDQQVRQVTYGYRQHQRSIEIQREKEKEETYGDND